MNRQAQAVVMLLFGGAVLKASLGDLYLRYVKEGLRPFLIGAGLLLVAAGVMTLWYELRPRRTPAEEHHHHEPRVGWLLILPVLGLLLVAPPALGSYAAAQAGSVLAAQGSASDYPPLPAGEPVDVGLLDYASRAVFDQGRSLTGRTLRLTGFVTPGPDGEPMLARMVLSCCAADGRPIKVGLAGNGPAGVAPDTWIRVVGAYSERVGKDPVNGAEVPYLQVQSWQEIAAPKQQYE
ncbi:TIGR03943 family putative permease subunit [Couchioplanes azureus]|uniref:TIGR03943 family putative permease subunit n=1 Tax=Couchioplanes caeruleus TaxID=56438 RepID=UPI001671662D|nr:TIGR03943 family protein [Couchioplanes caeruleus]GGQ59929.1 membrane protein [Couchioplanes caeruleus subsp. azureus]